MGFLRAVALKAGFLRAAALKAGFLRAAALKQSLCKEKNKESNLLHNFSA